MFIRKPAPAPCTGEETRAGLENRAASCYFNSIVQSLAASSLLEETLRIPPPHSAPASDPASDLQYTPLNLDVNASAALKRLAELNSDKDSGAAHVHDEDLPLITTAVSLIRKLQNSKSSDRTISTADLHKVLSRKNPDYDGISQQDAHEALLALVDQLHLEELDVGTLESSVLEPH